MNGFRESLSRFKLAYILAILIALNVIRFWPHKKSPGAAPGFPPPSRGAGAPMDGAPPGPDFGPPGAGGPPGRERMEAMLQKLPAEQRQAMEQRMAEDRKFFDSVRDLPDDERRQKMQEHFAQNPPPFPPSTDGGPMGPPPGGAGGPGAGPGGNGPGPNPFGNNGGMHLPPPAARRSMDQHIANAQKEGKQ